MNKVIKSTLAVAASAVTLASTMAPSLVSAWGNAGGLRPTYTLEQLNNGELGNDIVFNSIVDPSLVGTASLADERNFVGARENTGQNLGPKNVWNEDEIRIEDGKEYLVRLYVHNNSPLAEGAVAEDVRVAFALPERNFYDTQHQINGFITASNDKYGEYWDYVNFVSDTPFKLTYVPGSASIENNGYGATYKADGSAGDGAHQLGDDIIKTEDDQDGVLIGYEDGDGKIPGCYQYSGYVGIVVKAEFADYSIKKQVRLVGTKEWKYETEANIGDKVEFQIEYNNLNTEDTEENIQRNVVINDVLPDGLRYVPGSTILYNADHPEGMSVDQDDVTTTGINIGNYRADSNAFVRFTAEVIDNKLECGSNALVNWAKGTIEDEGLIDYATVMTNKVCEDKPTPELPKTGPETVTGAIVTAGVTVTVAGYYIASRRSLR